jgi:hypothetical protein
MIQFEINSLILKDRFKFHEMIKNDLLQLINESSDEGFKKKDIYFNDDLSKTDWPLANNWEREWVKRYQQYGFKQTHGWHIHARNYTGAYYLELPQDAPYTEFIYPSNLNKGFTIEVKEGDIIFFPCYFMHRSKASLSKKTKTIISWNLDFFDILDKHIGEKESVITL